MDKGVSMRKYLREAVIAVSCVLFLLQAVGVAQAVTAGGGGGHIIRGCSGGDCPQQPAVNFSTGGGGTTCTDDVGNSETDCNILTDSVPGASMYVAGHLSPAEIKNAYQSPTAVMRNMASPGDANSGWRSSGPLFPPYSIKFDGTDDFVEILGTSEETWGTEGAQLSIELYFNADTTTANRTLIGYDNWAAGCRHWQIRIQSDNRIEFAFNEVTGDAAHVYATPASVFADATTYKMAFTYQFSETAPTNFNWELIDMDGNVTDIKTGSWTTNDGIGLPIHSANCENISIGAIRPSSPGLLFDGTIDNVSIWKSIRTATERARIREERQGEMSSANLFSYLRFDEGRGTVLQNEKTQDNTVLWQAAGCKVASPCLKLDGVDDYLKVDHIAEFDFTADFSLEMWINRDRTATEEYLIGKRVASGSGFDMKIDASGNLVGTVYDSGGTGQSCTGTTALAASTDYQVGIAFDETANTLVCIVNGSAENTNSSATNDLISVSGDLIFGSDPLTLGSSTFDGEIDEISVYNAALATATFNTHYNAGSPSPLTNAETNIQGLWHLDNGAQYLATQEVIPASAGDDTLAGTSTGTACRTIAACIAKIPSYFGSDVTLYVASGIYNENILINGRRPNGDNTVTLIGYTNATPNSFSNASASSGTTETGSTANFPHNASSLFYDAGASFTANDNGESLHITGGNADAGYCADDDKNWYRIDRAQDATNVYVSTIWENCGTPDNAAVYEIFRDEDMARIKSSSAASGVIDIQDSSGIAIKRLGMEDGKFGINLQSSTMVKVIANTMKRNGRGMDIVTGSVQGDVLGNSFSYNGSHAGGAGLRVYQYGSISGIVRGNLFRNNYFNGFATAGGATVTGIRENQFDFTKVYAAYNPEQCNLMAYGVAYNRFFGNSNGIIVSDCITVLTGDTAIIQTGGYGIIVGANTRLPVDINIEGNALTDHEILYSGKAAVWIQNHGDCVSCSGFTLTGNYEDIVGTWFTLDSLSATLTATTYNNYDTQGKGFLTFFIDNSGGSSSTITGFSGGVNGAMLYIFSETVVGDELILAAQSTSSLPENRIKTNTGADITTVDGGAFILVYDGSVARWVVVSWIP